MYTRFFRWASDRLEVGGDGVIALITGRKPFAKGAYDGFRKAVAQEFNEVYVVDLGGDVRDNPKISGTKHNVFGIQTGVAICFLVKRQKQRGCKIFYIRRPEFDTAEDKLSWLAATRLSDLQLERIEPDNKADWLNQSDNEWGGMLPLCSPSKNAKRNLQVIFRLMSNGVQTKRDEWVFDFDRAALEAKAHYLIETYENVRRDSGFQGRNSIKWDADLEKYLRARVEKKFEADSVQPAVYRPFTAAWLFFDRHFNSRQFKLRELFPAGKENYLFCLGNLKRAGFGVLATNAIPNTDMFLPDVAYGFARYRYAASGERVDNITDWALKEFHKAYGKDGRGTPAKDGEGDEARSLPLEGACCAICPL